ncbi:MAG TPA: hypothetical protein DCE76_06280, partial [Anaerolineaceae bacterium]|nr:hypothetical protein [Anaerolineaceae bacterium]
GNEYGVYAAILTHLRFWYKLVDGNIQYNCSVHATGASENANIAYAMKGAITNALGNAVSNIGFQESVYLGLRSHKDFQPAPNGNGNGKAYAPKPAPAPTGERMNPTSSFLFGSAVLPSRDAKIRPPFFYGILCKILPH